MGRLARQTILHDGCYAHVFSRSFENRRIFSRPEDYTVFKKLLSEIKREWPFNIFHYCLMRTHFHMVVYIHVLAEFSRALQILKRVYTVRYNARHKRSGPLWRERFKSMLIENEGYLYACGLYVENNPVKAGIVKDCRDWPHSSSRFYLSGEKDPLVDCYDLPGLPQDVDIDNSQEFEKGNGIGSPLFKLYLKEQSLSTCPLKR